MSGDAPPTTRIRRPPAFDDNGSRRHDRASGDAEPQTTPEDRPVMGSLASSLNAYTSREQREALRGGLGDAASICDIIVKEIKAGGRPSKRRREMMEVAKLCADTIWAQRGLVDVP